MAKTKRAHVPTPPRQPSKQPGPLLTRNRVLAVVGVGAALAIALVTASLLSARGDSGGGGNDGGATEIAGAADVEALLKGIPQDEISIGEADAPVTLVEFADLQCPFCAQWSRQTFPELAADYVRAGQLRIEFRGLSFIGPESEQALRGALGAGYQDKLWNVVDLIYVNQGAENSGWATEDFLRAVGEAVPGLDADRMLEMSDSAEVNAAIEQSASDAESNGVQSTPSFLIGTTGNQLDPLPITSLGPEEFRAAIDELLSR